MAIQKAFTKITAISLLLWVYIFAPLMTLSMINPASAGHDHEERQEKVNVCHKTSSRSNPWEALSVSNVSIHVPGHTSDYLYAGPVYSSGPHQGEPLNNNHQADEWCENFSVNHSPVISSHSNITEHTFDPTGKVITFTKPTATDTDGDSVTVTCTPASGTKFVIGTTTVTCTANDGKGGTDSTTFAVTVILDEEEDENTAPIINAQDNVTVHTTNPDGTEVEFTNPTATDEEDGTAPVVCTPASGSVFEVGTTEVTCVATDEDGATDTTHFNVIVILDDEEEEDNDIRFCHTNNGVAPYNEQTTNYHAVLSGHASEHEGDIIPPFTYGDDGSFAGLNWTTEGQATWNNECVVPPVEENHAPTISCTDITETATSIAGFEITAFSNATANDVDEDEIVVTYNQTLPHTFPIGETVVTCTVTDEHEATASDTFTVTITAPIVVDTTAPSITFDGFKDQANGTYDSVPVTKVCGSINESGFISWEWHLNNVEIDPVTYTYEITSGPTDVGYNTTTVSTHYNGQIPTYGTYVVEVFGTDAANNKSNVITCSVVYRETPTEEPTEEPTETPTTTPTATPTDGTGGGEEVPDPTDNDEEDLPPVTKPTVLAEVTTPSVTPTIAPEVLGERTCTNQVTLIGMMYVDANKNGNYDFGEQVFSNITGKVTYNVDQKEYFVDHFISDNNGKWEMKLCPGEYNITVNKGSLPRGITDSADVHKINVLANPVETTAFVALLATSSWHWSWWWLLLVVFILAVIYYIYRKRREYLENNAS